MQRLYYRNQIYGENYWTHTYEQFNYLVQLLQKSLFPGTIPML